MMDNSYKLITYILESLFVAEHRRMETEVVRLHRANKAAWGKPADGFIYPGEFYLPKGTPGGVRTNLPLHQRLQGEGDFFIKDKAIIDNDSRLIHQLLFKLLEPCFNYQDIRCATPECVVDTLPDDIKKLDRHRQPTFFLNHPRDFKLYDTVLPKLEFYSASRLFY